VAPSEDVVGLEGDPTAQIFAPFDLTRKPPLSVGILDGHGIFSAVLSRICLVPDVTGNGADELSLLGPVAGQL